MLMVPQSAIGKHLSGTIVQVCGKPYEGLVSNEQGSILEPNTSVRSNLNVTRAQAGSSYVELRAQNDPVSKSFR